MKKRYIILVFVVFAFLTSFGCKPIQVGSNRYSNWINSELGIEVKFRSKGFNRWLAIIHPYSHNDRMVMNTKLFRNGMVVNDIKIKFPKDINVAVMNRNYEVIFVEIEDGIIAVQDGELIKVHCDQLEKTSVWNDKIKPFLEAGEDAD